ncbi:MAG TPA: hypothetical protein VMF13_05395 [Luteitalea sp.]|nr:hypothetical protein [Luteitalea sp.]
MLVLLPAVVLFLALNVWIFVTSLRSGMYRIRVGSSGPHVTTTVSRQDRPGTFHLLAAFNAASVLVLAYVVYVMAGLTYESIRAGQWN